MMMMIVTAMMMMMMMMMTVMIVAEKRVALQADGGILSVTEDIWHAGLDMAHTKYVWHPPKRYIACTKNIYGTQVWIWQPPK